MNFIQNQISELLLNIADSQNGTNLLFQITLDTFMKSERGLHQIENQQIMPMVFDKEKPGVMAKKWF